MNHTCIEVRHPSPERTEVWLNRPEVRNAFNDAMIAELTQAFAAIARDRRVRVVLLAAQGKAFCAGADLNASDLGPGANAAQRPDPGVTIDQTFNPTTRRLQNLR